MRQLYIPATALLAFSYPLTTVWILQLGLPAGAINVFIKAILSVMFAVSLFFSARKKRVISIHLIVIYGYFCIYGIRLLYDIFILEILPPRTSASYILLYFFGLTLMPAVSVGFSFVRSDLPLIHKWIFRVLVLTNLSLLYYVLVVKNLAAEDAFSGRLEVRGDDGISAVLNPIVVSLMGAALALFVLGRLAVFPKMPASHQLLHVGLFGVGMTNLLAGGSRGPVVDFAVGLFFIGGSIAYGAVKRQKLEIRPRVILYLIAMSGGLVFLALSSNLSIFVFDRFKLLFSGHGDRTYEARDYIFAAAWQDFTNAPFIGHSYLTLNGTALPHNAFLESLTALGILGGAAYIVLFSSTIRGIWNGLMGEFGPFAYSVSLSGLALLALSFTSGSVAQSPEIWVMTTLMICMASAGLRQIEPHRESDRMPSASGGRARRSLRVQGRN